MEGVKNGESVLGEQIGLSQLQVKKDLQSPVDDETTASSYCSSIVKTDLQSDEEIFLGFSPPSSPGKTAVDKTALRIAMDIQRKSASQEEPGEEMEVDPVPASESPAPAAAPLPEVPLPSPDISVPKLPEQSIAGSSTKRRNSRNSSPTGSLSPSSNRRSISVSSRESKTSLTPAPTEGAFNYRMIIDEDCKMRDQESDVSSQSFSQTKSDKELSGNLADIQSQEKTTFKPEPIIHHPQQELVRTDTPVSVRKSGRVPTPSSNYKIVERMEELSRKRAAQEDSHMAPPKRAKLVLKFKTTNSTMTSEVVPKKRVRSIKVRKNSDKPSGSHKKGLPIISPPTHRKKTKSFTSSDGDGDSIKTKVCSIGCPKAMGLIPSLQCFKCLCLYHPECVQVGSSTNQSHSYVCKNCSDKMAIRKPEPAPIPSAPAPAPAPAIAPTPQILSNVPQTIITLNQRRFIMVPNLGAATPSSPVASPIPSKQTTQAPPSIPAAVSEAPPTADIAPIVKPEGAAKKRRPILESSSPAAMQTLCFGYSSLLHVFRYLTTEDMLRASKVCKLWKDLAHHPSLWRSVNLNGCRVRDWSGLIDTLVTHGTRSLDMVDVIDRSEANFASISRDLANVSSLKELKLGKVTLEMLENVLETCRGLQVCNAQYLMSSESKTNLSLAGFSSDHKLKEISIKCEGMPLQIDKLALTPLGGTLQKLSLLNFDKWLDIDLSALNDLPLLTDLAIGNCSSLPAEFPTFLASLTALRRLRLEVCTYPCDLLYFIRLLPNLTQLELVNFNVRFDFDTALGALKNIQSLLLVPVYMSQASIVISRILEGLEPLRGSLRKLVWVVTNELLNLISLIADQPSDKPKKAAGSCVPIQIPDKGLSEEWSNIREKYGGPVAFIPLSEFQELVQRTLAPATVHVSNLPCNETTKCCLEQFPS